MRNISQDRNPACKGKFKGYFRILRNSPLPERQHCYDSDVTRNAESCRQRIYPDEDRFDRRLHNIQAGVVNQIRNVVLVQMLPDERAQICPDFGVLKS